MSAKKTIDDVFEKQEQAVVNVSVSGTPQSVQRAIKQLAKKPGVAKSVTLPADTEIKPELKKKPKDDKKEKDIDDEIDDILPEPDEKDSRD